MGKVCSKNFAVKWQALKGDSMFKSKGKFDFFFSEEHSCSRSSELTE